MAETCTKCGDALEADDKFCGNCGQPVGGDTAAIPPPPPPPSATSAASTGLSAGAIGMIVAVATAAIAVIFVVTRSSDDSSLSTIAATTSTTAGTTTTSAPTTTAAPTTTVAPTTSAAPTTTAAIGAELPPGVPYSGFDLISDETGTLEMSVPIEWTDRNITTWIFGDEPVGPALSASPDLAGYLGGWTTPGVFYGASTGFGMSPGEFLDANYFFEECTYDGRDDYDDGAFVGVFDSWINCGGTATDFITIVAEPNGLAGTLVVVEISAVTDADLDALEEIISSFNLLSAVGG